MANYSYTYISTLESEEKMLSDLAAILTQHQVQNPERYAFMLIVSEAFTNALLHGNQMNSKKKIYLNVDVNSKQLSADITDEGEAGLKHIEAKKPSQLEEPNGRGVDLIRLYASSAEFSETENGGTKVSIVVERKLEKVTS